jgi:hypothetical protein
MRLFEAGVLAAAQAANRPPDGHYICPLCLGRFTRDDLEANRLTVEHAPPEAVGGRSIALSCKACNNSTGTVLDSQVAAREQFIDGQLRIVGASPLPKTRATFIVGDASVRVEIERHERSVYITALGHRNAPEALRAVDKAFDRLAAGDEDVRPEVHVELPGQRFHGTRALIGDLKSAYLATFAKLGYRWALQPTLDAVRQQLKEPGTDFLPQWWIGALLFDRTENRVGLAWRPIACVHVQLKRTTVLLPLWQEATSFYQHVHANADRWASAPFPGRRLRWPRGMEMLWDAAAARPPDFRPPTWRPQP